MAVLGASNLTYAEATWTQTLPDWIGLARAPVPFLGATPRLLVPDNLKSAIHKASFYDPEVNRSYGSAMATHYGVGISACSLRGARATRLPWKPGCVYLQSYILGRLRNVTFFSLAECNAAIAVAVERMNSREMRRLRDEPPAVVRGDQAAERCRHCRKLTSSMPKKWRLARVGIDYHVLEFTTSSTLCHMPTSFASRWIRGRQPAPLWCSTTAVGSPHTQGAMAGRDHLGQCPSTCPSAHRRYAEWTPSGTSATPTALGRTPRS